MAEIGFYHLTRTTADAALPPLLGRTLASGQRAVVRCGDAAHLAALDRALWLCPEPDWLPHGGPGTDAALQPILLTLEDERPNGARFLFLLEGARAASLDDWQRVFDLFDGTDDAALAGARRRWSEAKAGGHALTYWEQGPGGWTRGAA
jgi:DNA polymerase-3 subunit chi